MTEADLRKKGKLEGQQTMARQMLAYGEPIEKIELYTQLSRQEIEQLQADR